MSETAKEENPQEARRLRVEISGAVQGVGFRPFVYRLAVELAVCGWVINDTRGVFIEVEGDRAQLQGFLHRLSVEAPPNARITQIVHDWLPAVGYNSFEIRHSDSAGARRVIILPDLATCPDCRAELLDPANRRHQYAFTNCTNCGPRFTIIESLPYDRPNTTMRSFALCPACWQEYTDPLDRRFHAQPNACPVCGPQLAFYATVETARREETETQSRDSGDTHMQSSQHRAAMSHWPQTIGAWKLVAAKENALRAAVESLRRGEIVAVKGLGGFHLMVDARSSSAVHKLRMRKHRPDKAFAIMARDLEQAAMLCDMTPVAAELLGATPAPIVLLPRRAGCSVAPNVAPDNPDLGVMLPYTPLHHLLLADLDFPVVATSGNLTDEPICTDETEAFERLGEIADAFLVHDRPIARHADDSVLWIVDDAPQILRRARGYAPLPLPAAQPLPTILGVGAHLKNTVALSIERQIFLSQHIGDLETTPAYTAFQRVIADFLRLYEATPDAIAHDLHPDYLSTRWAVDLAGWEKQRTAFDTGTLINAPHPSPIAQSLNIPLIPVQHHHAHLAACLADNGADGPALGLIWDGTGYGLDGTIWGGECLLGDAGGFTRVAHLRPFRLPGGDAAVREPRRVALALLWELYGADSFTWEWLLPVRSFAEDERRLLASMLAKGINAPVTTSMGRLFDGVAALLGLHQRVTFEGQAAMALEHCAPTLASDGYRFELVDGDQALPIVLDWAPLIARVLDDLRRGVDRALVAARFHLALTELGVTIAQRTAERTATKQVALSGGCFQNRRLTEQMAQRLRDEGFTMLLHRQVPPNDGCISLGQVMVAAKRISSAARAHGSASPDLLSAHFDNPS